MSPETIWLSPECETNTPEGRQWCEDNIWDDGCGDDECNSQPVKYVRADLASYFIRPVESMTVSTAHES